MAILDEYQKHCRILAENGDPLSGISLLINQFNLISASDVYHYTDINGFISIMQNQELWASHIAFMNDKSEYLHGKDLFLNQFKGKMASVSGRESEFLRQTAKGLEDEMAEVFLPRRERTFFPSAFLMPGIPWRCGEGTGKTAALP